MIVRKIRGAVRLAREASRWMSFRRFCRGVPGSGLHLERLDYLPGGYVDLLGAAARLAPAEPPAMPVPAWKTDTLSGHRFPDIPAPFMKLRYGRGIDPKIPWERSSFRWAVLRAASSPGDDNWFREWAGLASDWVRSNPPGMGINWLSPMECSRRAVNLALTASSWWPLLRSDGELDELLAGTIAEHAEFVSRNPEVKPDGLTTNHTTANYCGLLAAALSVPGHPGSPSWVRQASDGLESCIARQIRRDGMSFEGSIPYSFLVLDIFAHGALLMRKAGTPPSTRYLDLLEGLFGFLFDTVDSGGNLPQVGDDDSGEWVTPRCAAMPAMMSALYRSVFGTSPGARSAFSVRIESGTAALKYGEFEALVAALPVGQEGLGGHNHEDLLQLCLSFRGIPVVVDPGTGSYNRDLGRRSLLRSMHSHNGPVPDGASHYYGFPVAAPFDLLSAREIRTSLQAGEKSGRAEAVVQAEVDGRMLVRTVILDENSIEVLDSVFVDGSRSGGFSISLTLDPRWKVEAQCENRLRLSTDGMVLEFESGVPVCVGTGLYSPRYDDVGATSVIKMHADALEDSSFRIGSLPCGK